MTTSTLRVVFAAILPLTVCGVLCVVPCVAHANDKADCAAALKGAQAMLLDGDASDESGAASGMDLAEDHAEGGALAGAVVAEEAENLTFGNIQ